ncbi:ATP-binding cassette domain-containing protein [Clostridium sp. MSJ-4]|uniref:ATP-binding cassette domain-containing protein n=1 Tax=Clostridium simiarum TaxID=2841506 RepID=A0ABS6EWH5_9CLOT|nr:ATP-binding cassette domain-containing protein [Clostridium simiarum]MBU5590580.1 ATP-binding cassette domain-containing protein [Clostridium simiarum]
MSAFCVLASKVINIGCLLIVAFNSKVIFLISIVYVVIIIYLNVCFAEKVRRDNLKTAIDERRVSYFYDMPLERGTSKEIRIYETQDEIVDQWRRANDRIKEYEIKRVFGLEIRSFVGGVAFYIFIIGVVVYEILMVSSGVIKADEFLMIYIMCENISNAILGISKSLLQVDYGLFALQRQFKFISTFEQIQSDESSKLTEVEDSKIVFEIDNMNFCYEKNVQILTDINLKINKGEIIALVGHNGSGKTTLVKVLLDLLKPTSVDMYFYGKHYRKYKTGL